MPTQDNANHSPPNVGTLKKPNINAFRHNITDHRSYNGLSLFQINETIEKTSIHFTLHKISEHSNHP